MPILSGEATSPQTSLKLICVSEQDPNATPGHAFISYVREDGSRVDRLQGILEAAGIRVWRDTANLGPGQDWKMQIREAITSSSLVFIACFSENSEMRQESYQYEELILAVEQMRSRRPGQPWLIPVRFAECQIPDFDLGAGRTLDSLQRVDLFGDSWETGAAKLVAAVLRILRLPYIQNGGSAPSQKGFRTLFRRMRTSGEISFGDVRSWAFCLMLGCIAIITSFLALHTWPPRYNSADTPIPDPHRYLCYAVVAVASFISVIAVLEGVVSSKWVNSGMRLEEARAAMNRRFWRFLRFARICASLAASILVLSGLVGFEDTAAVVVHFVGRDWRTHADLPCQCHGAARRRFASRERSAAARQHFHSSSAGRDSAKSGLDNHSRNFRGALSHCTRSRLALSFPVSPSGTFFAASDSDGSATRIQRGYNTSRTVRSNGRLCVMPGIRGHRDEPPVASSDSYITAVLVYTALIRPCSRQAAMHVAH